MKTLGVPYGPFVEVLLDYVTHASEEAPRCVHMCSLWAAELAKNCPRTPSRLGELPPPQSADPDTSVISSINAVGRIARPGV